MGKSEIVYLVCYFYISCIIAMKKNTPVAKSYAKF